jgi:hypothetical protein
VLERGVLKAFAPDASALPRTMNPDLAWEVWSRGAAPASSVLDRALAGADGPPRRLQDAMRYAPGRRQAGAGLLATPAASWPVPTRMTSTARPQRSS